MIKRRLAETALSAKTKVMKNKLRTGAVLCVLLVLSGFFMPFMSAKAEVSVTGVMNNTLEIISQRNDMLVINLGDFVLQKPIDEIQIYNTALGDIKLFDQSVLEILRNPIPNNGIVGNVNQVLSSSALDFLVDPKIQEIIVTRFERGAEINTILLDTWNMIQSAKSIVGAVNDISIQTRQSMEQVNDAMATIDGYKSMANSCVFILFIIMIGLIALILYKRANVGISIFLSGIMLLLFSAAGIGTAFANNQINSKITVFTGQINNSVVELIRSVLSGTFGDIGTYIANFIGERADFLKMSFIIQLDMGYWIILLGLAGSFVLLILLGRQNKKQDEEKKLTEELMIETSESLDTQASEGGTEKEEGSITNLSKK